jgi:cation transport regulator ChaB
MTAHKVAWAAVKKHMRRTKNLENRRRKLKNLKMFLK